MTLVTECAERGALSALLSHGFLPHCHGYRGGLALSLARPLPHPPPSDTLCI